MRISGTVTSISWIPSEAVTGLAKLPFGGRVAHYDVPPPDTLAGDQEATLEELRSSDRFRFANRLSGWIEVAGGRIVAYGQSGGGLIGSTTLRLGTAAVTVAATSLPDLCPAPELGDRWVRFSQTCGGRTGVPAPRTVKRKPFLQYQAPIAWSTLQLTLHADGAIHEQLVGASPFPRHWVYNSTGSLVAKSGIVDFKDWYKNAFGDHTPWGDLDSAAFVTAAETALERELSTFIMRGGAKPKIRRIGEGDIVVRQGDRGDELFVVLDGVVGVEVDGVDLGALGPGSVFGEWAILEAGLRRATVRALSACKVAVAPGELIDRDVLARLSEGHRREEIC